MTRFASLRTSVGGVLLLVSAWSCSPAQDPAALPPAVLSLSRTFDYTNPARQLSTTYQTGQLTGSSGQNSTALTLLLGPVGASQQATDGFTLTLPTANLKPGLLGTYAVDAANQPFGLSYFFTPDATGQTGQPGQVGGTLAANNTPEPASSLTISSYDATRGLIAGRFTLLFTISDPLASRPRNPVVTVPDELVRVTLTGTFADLPLRRNQ
jgi:hypothetical protein